MGEGWSGGDQRPSNAPSQNKAKKGSPVTPDQVRAFLVEAEKGNTSAKDLNARIRLVERETKDALLFESLDLAQPNAVPLRKSYLKK
jgi:hypothetical protein